MNTKQTKPLKEWRRGEEAEPGHSETGIAAWFLYFLFFFGILPMWEEAGWVFIICTLCFAIFGFYFFLPRLTKTSRSSALQAVQAARMKQATRILKTIKSGKRPSPFFLFLRATYIEGETIDWYNSAIPVFSPIDIYGHSVHDELSLTLNDDGLLLGLGIESDPRLIGVARVPSTDKSWRQDIKLLMQHSKGIILFPWPRNAVKEEISLVYGDDKILKKTAFFMPPADFLPPLTEGIWVKLRQEMLTYGIELPEYDPRGSVYNAFGVRYALVGTLTSRGEFRAALLDAMSQSN